MCPNLFTFVIMIIEVKEMKKIYKYIFALMLCLSLAGCQSSSTSEEKEDQTDYLSGNYQVEIKVKNYGTIKAAFL